LFNDPLEDTEILGRAVGEPLNPGSLFNDPLEDTEITLMTIIQLAVWVLCSTIR